MFSRLLLFSRQLISVGGLCNILYSTVQCPLCDTVAFGGVQYVLDEGPECGVVRANEP